jgi:hypothetical protein
VEQIAFVGERYGGAQERFVSICNEAALIVSKLLLLFDNWLKVVREAKPLVQRVPNQADRRDECLGAGNIKKTLWGFFEGPQFKTGSTQSQVITS